MNTSAFVSLAAHASPIQTAISREGIASGSATEAYTKNSRK